jgi:hypothetical protein
MRFECPEFVWLQRAAISYQKLDRTTTTPRSERVDLTLIDFARLIADRAAAMTRPFLAYTMAPSFISELEALIQASEEAVRNRDAARTRYIEARANVTIALASGNRAVRTLDVIVANAFRGDRQTLEAWAECRRLGYGHRPKRAPVAA